MRALSILLHSLAGAAIAMSAWLLAPTGLFLLTLAMGAVLYALAVIDEYIANGWLRAFESEHALEQYVGGRPILNKFACLIRKKYDELTKLTPKNGKQCSGCPAPCCTRRPHENDIPKRPKST